MDKPFWTSIRVNNYSLPTGYDLLPLTEELFSYLGSTNPELRDDIAYETLANWLDQGLYTPDQIRGYILQLTLNLQDGLGEEESDSVFLRTFSVLMLAEIVNYDGHHLFLNTDEVRNILAKGISYIEAEADSRGYVPQKGWAHALAHTADLFLTLARHPRIQADGQTQILNAITEKLLHATNWVYAHGEDDRLARAVSSIFERNLLSADAIKDWLASLVTPKPNWRGAWTDEARTVAYFNVRNFLRALHLRVIQMDKLEHKAEWQSLLLEANTNLKPN